VPARQRELRPSLQSIMGAMQQRRSKSFIVRVFSRSVSVVDDWSDWHWLAKRLRFNCLIGSDSLV
jgi:hypothetical protein